MRWVLFFIAFCIIVYFVWNRDSCHAIDGDTLKCGNERVRLANVYCAEMSESGGWSAYHNLQTMVNSGKLHIERIGRDIYGRTLANIFVDGLQIEQRHLGPKAGRGIGIQQRMV